MKERQRSKKHGVNEMKEGKNRKKRIRVTLDVKVGEKQRKE